MLIDIKYKKCPPLCGRIHLVLNSDSRNEH